MFEHEARSLRGTTIYTMGNHDNRPATRQISQRVHYVLLRCSIQRDSCFVKNDNIRITIRCSSDTGPLTLTAAYPNSAFSFNGLNTKSQLVDDETVDRSVLGRGPHGVQINLLPKHTECIVLNHGYVCLENLLRHVPSICHADTFLLERSTPSTKLSSP